MSYLDIVDAITDRLEHLREASALVTLVTVRSIVVATILKMAPKIFERHAKDGTSFRCSDSYLRKWLHGTLLLLYPGIRNSNINISFDLRL